jgi:hypothetical protein
VRILSDHLLSDLQLRHGELGVADAVCRNLEQILEQSDAPAHDCGDIPFAVMEFFKCAYQAKVMNTFDPISNKVIFRATDIFRLPPTAILRNAAARPQTDSLGASRPLHCTKFYNVAKWESSIRVGVAAADELGVKHRAVFEISVG